MRKWPAQGKIVTKKWKLFVKRFMIFKSERKMGNFAFAIYRKIGSSKVPYFNRYSTKYSKIIFGASSWEIHQSYLYPVKKSVDYFYDIDNLEYIVVRNVVAVIVEKCGLTVQFLQQRPKENCIWLIVDWHWRGGFGLEKIPHNRHLKEKMLAN